MVGAKSKLIDIVCKLGVLEWYFFFLSIFIESLFVTLSKSV
jgi:hypothetical protein